MQRFSDNFNKSFEEVVGIEGGYVNDPLDSGKATKYGITTDTARIFGYHGDMKDFSLDEAKKIYKYMFWNKLRLDEFPFAIANELFEIAVNCGTYKSGIFLQRCLNALNDRQRLYKDIDIDGQIGPVTVQTFRDYVRVREDAGVKVLHKMLNCLQGAFYIELTQRREKDERFLYGWIKNRVVL